MAHARRQARKRKQSTNSPGGLGGRGGRGGRRWSVSPNKGKRPPDMPRGALDMNAEEMARAVKAVADADESGYGTSYRTAMSTISAFANANSKSMLPERRKKLAAAKDELRDLYGRPQHSKGARDPGQKHEKPKAKSRRNPR